LAVGTEDLSRDGASPFSSAPQDAESIFISTPFR